MSTINFIFAVHNHQPVGNFEPVLERCFTDCYQPFIDMLTEFPSVRLALHYSGPLLQFIERKHPYYIERLRTLVARNQVEMMGGGFYEPILPVIPPRDALGQIRKMADWLEGNLGQRPRGLWLPERVWEPQLASLLADAGVSFTMVDDTHLRAAGVGADEIVNHYVTEDNGRTLAILPVDRKLRYLIPFHLPEETIEYFRWTAGREAGLTLTLGDDGEKFGVWPETHKWVYDDGYLRRLFGLLHQNREWIQMVLPSEYLAHGTPRGRVYLPTASYTEMMEWALPTPAREAYEDFLKEMEKRQDFPKLESFVRGGQWRNFLTKYPESNLIHKKMLFVSRVVEERKSKSTSECKGGIADIERAEDELWQGQCNCAYWHGLFGGLYLSHLRHALYEHLIAAEDIVRKASAETADVKRLDYDCDGREEVLMTSPQLTVGIAPAYGGSVFELDFLPARFNLANTLTRRREAYHRLIATAVTTAGQHGGDQPLSIHSVQRAKEKGLEEHLVEDWYARRLFQDHFFGASATLRGFSRCRYPELGDFVNRPLEVLEAKRTKDGARVVLQREGGIYEGNAKTPVTIVKTFVIEPDGALSVRYEISSPVEKEMTAWFGSELNFTLLGSTAPGFHYDFGYRVESVSSLLDLQNIEAFSIVNTPMGFACDLALSPSAQLWSFPVETVSQSEGGLERTYQGSSLTAHWRLKLNREKPAVVSLRIKPRTL